jgi:hypothetical protein
LYTSSFSSSITSVLPLILLSITRFKSQF